MLKIYQWEHSTFRDLYAIYLTPKYRSAIIDRIAKLFGIQLRWCTFDQQCWAHAYGGVQGIKFPKSPFPLGLAIHELAHLYNYQKNYGAVGHRKTFKTVLIKLMIETKYELPRLLHHG